MAITCPRCGAELDVTLFAFERTVRCTCGAPVDAGRPHAPGPRRRESPDSDMPRIDVDLAIASLRDWVRAHLPDRLDLFEMVWAARWERLRDQGWEHRQPDR